MRTFNVNVNGVLYQVEVEEIAAGAPAAAPAARPAAGPRRPIPGAAPARPAAPKAAAPKPAPKAAPAPAAAPAGKGENINAPMPGNILDVRVANGRTRSSPPAPAPCPTCPSRRVPPFPPASCCAPSVDCEVTELWVLLYLNS